MLLRRLGRRFRVVRCSYREIIRSAESPSRNAMRNALGKARSAQLPPGASGIVVSADTFLYFRRRVVGKPTTIPAAKRLLQQLSGKRHWVYTGLCLLDPRSGKAWTSYEKTRVTFQRLPETTLHRLLTRGSPLDKAGGYALQEDRGDLIQRLDGSRTNVIGLPLELLRRELRAFRRMISS